MHDSSPSISAAKITEQERQLVDMIGNLADAQVYLPLTERQVSALPGIELICQPRPELDMLIEKERFLIALAAFHGGIEFPPARDLLFGYSASMGIEIVANALRLLGLCDVGLLHPTYDAAYHILVRHNARLSPVSEVQLDATDTELEALMRPLDALMLTQPNNPTGWAPDAAGFARIARAAARTETCLVVDACFRAYDARCIDHYKILRAAGAAAIVIEDTGKLFAIKDLKIGTLWAQGPLRDLLADIHRDWLLDVPLFALITLRQLLESDGRSHAARLRATVARNRSAANVALAPLGLKPVGATLSNVQLLRLPVGLKADQVQSRAYEAGVGVVSANGYFWAGVPEGEFIRIALARHPDEFDRQFTRLATVLAGLQPARTAGG